MLLDGSPNPLHGPIHFSKEMDKSLGKDKGKGSGEEEAKSVGEDVVVVDAPSATTWEAKLSFPPDNSVDLLEALGLKLPADASQADREKAKANQKGATQTVGDFANINRWSVWPGATVLVVAGLMALAFQWRSLGRTFASIFAGLSGGQREAGPIDHIEIPMRWFAVGFPIAGLLATLLLIWIFHIQWWMGLAAVVMTFFLAAVVARAGAETSINPIGAMGKVTQLTFGALRRATSRPT